MANSHFPLLPHRAMGIYAFITRLKVVFVERLFLLASSSVMHQLHLDLSLVRNITHSSYISRSVSSSDFPTKSLFGQKADCNINKMMQLKRPFELTNGSNQRYQRIVFPNDHELP